MSAIGSLLVPLAAAAAPHAAEQAESIIAFDGAFFLRMFTHIVAFLVFLWVLARYAWGPLTDMIESRRKAVEQQFEKIEMLRLEAHAIEEDYQARIRDIDAEARARITEAVAEGRRVKDEIVARARQEAEDLRAKQERLLQLEVAKARIELRDHVARLTVAATEKLLRENLDGDRQRRLVSDFITEVEGLPRENN